MDGDGDMDLVGFFNGDQFKWAQNDGSGTLAAFAPAITTGPVSAHVFGDTDGNGTPDLVYVSTGNTIRIATSAGGTFAAPVDVTALPGEAGRIALSDLNGDGAPEIIVSVNTGSTSRIATLANNGGIFGAPGFISDEIEGSASTILLAGAIDEFPGNDVLFMNSQNAMIGLMNVNGDASEWQQMPLFYLFDYQFVDPQLIDIDQDGDLDIAEAHQTVIQWAENRLSENIPFNEFTIRVIEPVMTAGVGYFADLGCAEGASVVYVPSDPSLPVRWTTYVESVARFVPKQDLPGVARGLQVILSDMNGDGKADLLIRNGTGLLLHLNELQPATTQLELPAFDTVCVIGPSIPLPDAIPSGGTWSGTWVTNNMFHRSSVGGTSTVPLAYTWYEPEGCPVAGLANMRVITGPQIEPFIGPIVCSGDGPFQLTSQPQATQWQGLSPGNILDLNNYNGELIVAQYTDPTGATCNSFMGPLNVWNTVPAEIVEIDTLCINSGVQTISAQLPWPDNTWSGDISGTAGDNALFDPSIGAGVYTIHLDRQPIGPQQCANSDSIVIVVNDVIPQIDIMAPEAFCTSTSSIDLQQFAQPVGGIWSGPGVAGNILLPFIAGPGEHPLSYSIISGGCSATAETSIVLASSVDITHESGLLSFCIDQDPVVLAASPAGGEWNAPVQADGTFDPATAGVGEHELVYVYTDPNGCMLVNPPLTVSVHEQQTIPVIAPVELLCITDEPVEITGTPAGVWSGAVEGIGTSVMFDPGTIGAGTWQVSLTAEEEGSCAGTTTIDVVVDVCTSIGDKHRSEAIVISPNPTNGFALMDLRIEGPVKWMLFDAVGRMVPGSVDVLTGPAVRSLDLSGLANGMYHLRAFAGDRVHHVELIKADR